ncbi:Tellurite resistance protein TerB [Sphingobium faniae]|uniref:tellurite resistance TerB family protein n=1 Tax=Rhizorhapis sp. SPR117 TaxID=2912611 RepID=UPI000876EC77|nr:TerB N-terminal domain-containing protein [Rhizorhapis sp. SPR117]SCW92596.1 Tellurite resistance protein TerB [Sphingobium faniae]
MGTIWKIIRIIGLYVVFFIASAIISAALLDSLPDAIEALFILFAPVAFIIWYEKRRTAKIALSTAPARNNPVRRRQLAPDEREAQNSRTASLPEYRGLVPSAHLPKPDNTQEDQTPSDSSTAEADMVTASVTGLQSRLPDNPIPSRTRELRERLFGDDSSIFDPKNADRVQTIASRSSAAGAEDEPDGPTEPAFSKAYRPQQDNAELVRVGKAAREALEAASLRRAAEKEAGPRQLEVMSSTEGPNAREVADRAPARRSRIEELRQKLFGGESRVHSPPMPAEPRPASRSAGSSVKVQGWLRKGQTVIIAGREIDGMVYVGGPPKINSHEYGEKCRTYIDPSLSVASSGSDRNGDGMSYWPGYSSIPAVCRATYLEWLAGGRRDGTVNPGYMFLFFYGLERRFLVDQPPEDEKREIVAEVERLKALFAQNYSVQRYLGEFLDIARIVAMGRLSLDDPALKQTILDNRSWELPFSLKFALGGMIAEGKAFDAEWLHLWLLCHPERRLRTPAERCSEEFKALFKLKFDALYPNGLKARTPRKKLAMNYRAASSEFSCSVNLTAGEGKDIAVPDVSDLRSPVQKAQKIADEAMDELDKFSRYLGRNANGRGSIEAQALLPAELWGLFPSAELEGLREWACGQVAGGGLIPALEVITRLEGSAPGKIGKRQLIGAADALARIGFGMAPDPRFSLRAPRSDEPVVIFDLGETVEQLEVVSPAYKAALFELALATFVAHSDSKIVEAERRALSDKVEATGGLTDLERKRLHANLKWYLEVPPDMSWLRSRLKEVDAEHHLALRAAVVVIAHADSMIQSEEVACIEKIYKALGIDAGLVYADLHAGDVPDGPVRVRAAEAEAPGERIPAEPKTRGTALDAARIAAIRSDTERVSNVLGEIFAADDDASDEATRPHALPSSLAGLDHRHAALVDLLIQREQWTQEEFADIAGKQGLLPSGALEAVNEWAFEKFDEALLDEYDGYDVSQDIAEALRAEMAKGDN